MLATFTKLFGEPLGCSGSLQVTTTLILTCDLGEEGQNGGGAELQPG